MSGSRHRGFTLIELMVVMGVLVLLVGVTALALRGGSSEAAALTNAQSIMSGLVSTARAQAALHQTNARLAVYAQTPTAANTDNTRYLRAVVVVREDPLDSNNWVAVGPSVMLPTPICVVPPPPVPTNHLALGVTWDNNVATGPVSTLARGTLAYRGQSGSTALQYFGTQGAAAMPVHFLQFGPDGSVVTPATGSIKIALSVVLPSTSATSFPQFKNRYMVRGLFIRRSGAVSLVDQADGF